jgi:hypothetical protein
LKVLSSLHLNPRDPTSLTPAPSLTCGLPPLGHTQTGNQGVSGVDGKYIRAPRCPRPAPSDDVAARPLTPHGPAPFPASPLPATVACRGGDGGVRTGVPASRGRGVLLFLGVQRVRGRRGREDTRGSGSTRTLACHFRRAAGSAREATGQSRPGGRGGAVGVAARAPVFAASGLPRTKPPSFSGSQFRLGSRIPLPPTSLVWCSAPSLLVKSEPRPCAPSSTENSYQRELVRMSRWQCGHAQISVN